MAEPEDAADWMVIAILGHGPLDLPGPELARQLRHVFAVRRINPRQPHQVDSRGVRVGDVQELPHAVVHEDVQVGQITVGKPELGGVHRRRQAGCGRPLHRLAGLPFP